MSDHTPIAAAAMDSLITYTARTSTLTYPLALELLASLSPFLTVPGQRDMGSTWLEEVIKLRLWLGPAWSCSMSSVRTSTDRTVNHILICGKQINLCSTVPAPNVEHHIWVKSLVQGYLNLVHEMPLSFMFYSSLLQHTFQRLNYLFSVLFCSAEAC